MSIQKEKLLEMYWKMVLVRKFEKKMDELIKSGKIKTMGHFGEGQEAVGIGICGPLRDDDYIFPTHRGFAEYIGKGMSIKDILLEYGGRKNSPTKGRGGIHLCYPSKGIMGLVGSLGADFSMAVGTALSSKMRGTDQVTLIYFGEGTSNQADFHPAMNMASLWKLPLIFACVNNQYTELDHYRNLTSTEDIAPRAVGYGMPGVILHEGNDIVAVYEATERAIARARKGEGPTLIEFKTYRLSPHYTGDPGGYQPKEEIEEWRNADPIPHCQKYLLEKRILTEKEDQKILSEIDQEIKEALDVFETSPLPDRKELYEDLYA
jgi:TPP-dependent pyruvate/acetoin dehydrogenase alpha subunit